MKTLPHYSLKYATGVKENTLERPVPVADLKIGLVIFFAVGAYGLIIIVALMLPETLGQSLKDMNGQPAARTHA